MHKFIIPVAASLCAAAVAVPAIARPPQPSSAGSSIAIASVNGTATNAASTLSSTVQYGSTMTFATNVQQLAGWQYPMVAVTCYQDLNGDGVVDTSNTSNEIVYSSLDKPSATFDIGSPYSIWGYRGGGSAVCRADLDSYGFKSGVEYVQVLASTGNWNVSG
jgi:hypothetical protein